MRVAPVAVVSSPSRTSASVLILAAIGASALLFGAGATPARFIPWRGAAAALDTRRLEVTLLGAAILATALFAFAVTRIG